LSCTAAAAATTTTTTTTYIENDKIKLYFLILRTTDVVHYTKFCTIFAHALNVDLFCPYINDKNKNGSWCLGK